MAGFLEQSIKGTPRDDLREDLYRRIFPKIGRDFVSKEDLVLILEQILDIIDPHRLHGIDLRQDNEAREKAIEYKDLVESGITSNRYEDLVEIDE